MTFKKKIMKKFIFFISLLGALTFLNACSVGYVTEIPLYDDGTRPQSPGESYIWIEGSWNWDNQSHSYHHRNGYWQRPHQGRNYESGYWNKTDRGYRWQPGRWRR